MVSDEDHVRKKGSELTGKSKMKSEPVQGRVSEPGVPREKASVQPHEAENAGGHGAARQRHLSVGSDLTDQIGARLRCVYDDVLAQPVPDRFLELLRQLESTPGTSLARAKKDGV